MLFYYKFYMFIINLINIQYIIPMFFFFNFDLYYRFKMKNVYY